MKKVCSFSYNCPLQILQSISCSQDVSKTIIASSLKLCQLIEDNEKLTLLKFKKGYFTFLSYCSLQIGTLETLIKIQTLSADYWVKF